jgi:hypothetical protein
MTQVVQRHQGGGRCRLDDRAAPAAILHVPLNPK